MSAAGAKKSDDNQAPPNKSTVILLFTIAADTTWRMFVPVIGGTILGVWADNTITDKPIGTVVGIAIGVIIATILVRQQMRKKL